MPPAAPCREEQFVTFHLAGETYGIPILSVQEIIRVCEITRVPRSAAYIRGVVNLRGSIVPVIDLRQRLGFAHAPESSESRIIVVDGNPGVVGMIVDGVSQVLRIGADRIQTASEWMSRLDADLVSGVGTLNDELIILLDIDHVLQAG